MRSLIIKIKKKLRQKRGETLIEAIISILLLAILLTTVTAMIQTSLRMTSNSMREADDLQKNTYNPAILNTLPDLSSGTIILKSQSTTVVDTQHDIFVFEDEDINDILSFYPDTDQFGG